MSQIDDPVRPAAEGTAWFTAGQDLSYTAGPEHVGPGLRRLLELSDTLAVDIETYGLGSDAVRLKCVSVSDGIHGVVADPRDSGQATEIARVLADARYLVLHNAMFDVPALVRSGLMHIEHIAKVTDTLLYARLAEPDEKTSKSLDAVAGRYLGATSGPDQVAEIAGYLGLTKSQGYARFDIDHPFYLQRAALDAITTFQLLDPTRSAARSRLTEVPFSSGVGGTEAESLLEREQRINRMLLRRTARGLRVDLDFAADYEHEIGAERARLEARLAEAGIRPGRGDDLCAWLDAAGHLPADHPRTPKTGAPQATKKALMRLQHPMAGDFIRHKELVKVGEDYLTKVRDLTSEAGRVHPSTSLLAATTGRASMADPPLQQFPDRARGIILADEGDGMTSLDWRSIEPAVVANVAGETDMINRYESGGDLYAGIAQRAGVSRKTAKTILLGVLYGEGVRGLSANLGTNADEAASLRGSILDAMPAVGWLEHQLKGVARKHALMFSTAGRMMPIPLGPGFAEGDPPQPMAYRGVNYFCQGSAYDELAEALIRIDDAGLGDAVYFTMHDEIVCSTAAADEIAALMCQPSQRLCHHLDRAPVLQIDRADLGVRWEVA